MASIKRKAKTEPAKERDVKRPKPTASKETKPTSVTISEGEAFRRGGADLLTPLERKQIRAKAKQDALLEEETGEQLDLLVVSEGEEDIGVEEDDHSVSQKQSKKKRKLSSARDPKQKPHKSSKIDGLSYKRIRKGLIVLGCVMRIGRRDITLALPNNLIGFVPITSISDGICLKLVEQDAESSADEVDTPRKSHNNIDISKFVKLGQYLRAVVTSIDEGSKKHISLSTISKDVNAGIVVEALVNNVIIQGDISSIEDHGAIVNLGLAGKDVRAFIPTVELDGRNLQTLEIGSPLLCSVTSSTSNGKVVKLSANSKRLDGRNSVKMVSDINALLPGTVIEFLVLDSDEHGIRGKMMDLVNVTADVVHSGQLSNQAIISPQSKTGSKLKARIIFTTPGDDSHYVGVSLLPHILSLSAPTSPDLESMTIATDLLPVSTIVDEMTVTKVDPLRGLLLDVGMKKIPGFAHVSRIADKRIKELSVTTGQWREGSTHRGRITGFNVLDGMFLVSLEEKVLELPFLSYEDARPGQIISGTVSKYKSHEGEIRGIVLKITDSISGLIPSNHLSDIQLQFPEKKFKIDSLVQARVLSVDPDRRRLTLTCKKSLLKSKATIWASYSDVQVGVQSPGTIIAFLPSGALVQFYDHLKGFLPTSEMSESFIKDPKEHFRIGQVITLRAITIDASNKRLIVSCRQDIDTSSTVEKVLAKLAIGDILSGKVSEKLADNFVLDLENTSIKAVLPISHLADGSEQKCNHAAKRIRVEQTLQELGIINLNKNKRYIRLTKRTSLIEALKSNKMPSNMEALDSGMEVTGFIKNITSIGVFVQFANSLTGLLPKSQIIESSSDLPDFGLHRNQTISCRISSIDLDQQRFFLTQKEPKSEISDKSQKQESSNTSPAITNPIDGTSTKFLTGNLTKAKITAVKDTQLNVKLADGIQGRIDISQLFDTWDKIKHKNQPLKSFQKGQILGVRIIGIHDAKNHKFLPITHQKGNPVFELTARQEDLTNESKSRLTLADMKIGETYLCFVNNVRNDHLWVNINTEIRGRINIMELTDDADEIANLADHYPVGRALQARVIQINASENRLDLSARPIEKARPQILEDLSVGQVVVGKVSKILEKLVIVQISDVISGAIHICDLEDDFSQANPRSLHTNQVLSTIVTSIDAGKKDLWLSKRPSRLSTSSIKPIQDSELQSIGDVKVNDIRRGFIKNISDQGLFISLSRDLTAFVRISELFDQFVKNWKDRFSLNQLVKGRVIVVKESSNQIQLSLKESVLDSDFSAPLTFDEVKVGQTHTGKVRKVEDFGVFVVLDKSKNVSGLCHRSEVADNLASSLKDLYNEGDSVKVRILKIDDSKKRINLGMKASYFLNDGEASDDDWSGIENRLDALRDASPLDQEIISEDEGGVLVQALNKQTEISAIRQGDTTGTIDELDLGGFDWTGGMAGGSSDLEMPDAKDQPAISKKRKHGVAPIQIDRTGDLDTNGAQSVSDFERLLMGQPNSSYLWLSYMAFHLQLSEVEQAKQIAERALRTINSESKATQDEALNVWIGFLNLENSYGDENSIEDVFKRACTHNDPKEVYTRLTSIYIQSGKQDVSVSNLLTLITSKIIQKATTLFDDMIKKFSSDTKVWQNYASFLFDVAEDAVQARALLPRAMQSLPAYTHIDIAVKFAQLEFKSAHGDSERGRTIFEGLITTFPKRLDLWNVLLDLEIKSGSQEQVRHLFDRVTSGKIKSQKAKFFFKKWLDYEDKNGDGKSQGKVKAKAAEFVRKHE